MSGLKNLHFYCAWQTFDLALQSVMDVAYIHWTSKRLIHSPISMNISLSLLHGPEPLGCCRKFFNHDGLFCPILLHLDITLLITQKYDHVESYNLVRW